MSPDLYTGYQSAHFARAAKMRIWVFSAQFFVAILAGVSVVVANGAILYWLALIGTALLLVYWMIHSTYRKYRNAAQAARRAGLIANGLGLQFSAGENRDLRQKFAVTEETARKFINVNYYASCLAPGLGRLAEIVEESAFYTAHLQSVSAVVMRILLTAVIALLALIAFATLPYAASDTMLVVVRVALSMLVFLLSTDFFGAMVAHQEAATSAKDVYMRLSRARAGNFPDGDVLLALSEYNAIVESAPEVLPYVYSMTRENLDRRWREYQHDAARLEAK